VSSRTDMSTPTWSSSGQHPLSLTLSCGLAPGQAGTIPGRVERIQPATEFLRDLTSEVSSWPWINVCS
jgi:hypothetical protein